MTRDGYFAEWEALRRASLVVRDRRDGVAEAKEALRQAFDRDRAALGHDAYGVELARQLPGIEERIFAAFDAYLAELDGTSEGLSTSAANYQSVELAERKRYDHMDVSPTPTI
ncbi:MULTISPECIES: hypothetical protein [unclassified Streptosporangium]|uniref:hypothetical protein n=1 Tax=unclassified Streptosporangium TaxID=2632669 RepID=UPI002E27BDF3|nr:MULTISPECIES: hypothetical protein [unclassified Streptosporangium]